MKRSDELMLEIDPIVSACITLEENAKAEGRAMTDAELADYNAKSKTIDELSQKREAAISFEANQRAVRAMRHSLDTPQPVFDRTGAGPYIGGGPQHVTPSLQAFKGNGDKVQAARDAHDCALWFLAMTKNDTDARQKLISRRGEGWFATQNETTLTDGGYLVPPTFITAVTVYRGITGVTRKLARVIPTNTDSVSFPKQSSGSTVYYVAEESSITPSSAQFSMVNLNVRKRAILTHISSELREDTALTIMDIIAADLGHQLALQEDKEFVLGDGTSTYGNVSGVKNAIGSAGLVSGATNNDTWPEITYADLAKCMAGVADKYQNLPMAWLCSASFKWQVFDRLCLAQGGSLATELVNGVPQGFFAGHPIVVTDRMPTTTAAATLCAIFGAFGSAVAFADRGLRIALSEHVNFASDQVTLRATSRYDIACHECGSSSSAGAIVGFKTAS